MHSLRDDSKYADEQYLCDRSIVLTEDGPKFSGLSKEEKNRYREIAKQEKANHEEAMKAWKLTEAGALYEAYKLRNPKPTRPVGPKALFVNAYTKENNLTRYDREQASKAWDALSDEERAEYQCKHDQQAQEYAKKQRAWKETLEYKLELKLTKPKLFLKVFYPPVRLQYPHGAAE
jgi:hypothetical protein